MFDVLVSVSSVKHCDNDYLIRRLLDCTLKCCHCTELNCVYQAARNRTHLLFLLCGPLPAPNSLICASAEMAAFLFILLLCYCTNYC